MKATGIVRRIDDLGRVVIPKELRRTMGLAEGDPLEIFVDGENIVFRRYRPGCALCGEADPQKIKIADFNGKFICRLCVGVISNTVNTV